jgi:4'-phosphopantetheinyl transferase EntD
VIEQLVAPPVVAVSTRALDAAPLHALERAALGRAAPGRLAEFATGRGCARHALAELGLRTAAIGRGPDREPLWPAGAVGSITHCAGYCAAAAAPAARVAAIGIDAEPDAALPRGVLEMVARPEERAWLSERRGEGPAWDRLLFSAKEATFKAWFPLARRWLGFADARVVFDPPRGRFEVTLLVAGPSVGGRRLERLEGRFHAHDGLLATAIVLAASGQSASQTFFGRRNSRSPARPPTRP